MDLHEVIAQSMMMTDEAEGRVYGWLPGIVTDVDAKLMRVKARVGRQGDNESTDWMLPMGMGSIESLPEVGDPVGVTFMDGDVHRGAYFYFPQSNTGKRPAEPIPLGMTMVGMFNYLVTQYNQLRSDFNTFVTVKYNLHKHATAGIGTPSLPDVTGSSTSANPGNKGKASDGSEVADKSSSEVVLSKRSLVR